MNILKNSPFSPRPFPAVDFRYFVLKKGKIRAFQPQVGEKSGEINQFSIASGPFRPYTEPNEARAAARKNEGGHLMEELHMGLRIARYRKELGLTQEALAQRLGVTNQAVSKWEGDVCCPDIQLLPELADALGLSLDALFGHETPEPQKEEKPAEEAKAEASPIGILRELPWADDDSLHAVLYQGHRLLQVEGIPERSGGGLLHLLAGQRDARQVVLRFTGTARDIYSAFAVHCEGDVGGSVNAGDGVTCGDVGGSVRAGDSVTCGSVEGDVSAGESVRCGSVGGDVRANDSVHVQGGVNGEVQQS